MLIFFSYCISCLGINLYFQNKHYSQTDYIKQIKEGIFFFFFSIVEWEKFFLSKPQEVQTRKHGLTRLYSIIIVIIMIMMIMVIKLYIQQKMLHKTKNLSY